MTKSRLWDQLGGRDSKSATQKCSNLKVFNASNFNEITLVTRNAAIVSSCVDHCLFIEKDAS